jgi:hypothetical protein
MYITTMHLSRTSRFDALGVELFEAHSNPVAIEQLLILAFPVEAVSNLLWNFAICFR